MTASIAAVVLLIAASMMAGINLHDAFDSRRSADQRTVSRGLLALSMTSVIIMAVTVLMR